jgi:hypothetical protein
MAPAKWPRPPGVEPEPAGCILDADIGRYRVRFLCVLQRDHAGPPAFLTVWKPDRPKRLKPAPVKKYRRERRNFVTTVAKQFGLAFQIIDRMDGAPRITELVSHDGAVVPGFPLSRTYSPRSIDERSQRRRRVSIPRLGAYPDTVARKESRISAGERLRGESGLSHQQRSLCKRAVWLELMVENEKSRVAAGGGVDGALYAQLVSGLAAVYRLLGIKRVAREARLAII